MDDLPHVVTPSLGWPETSTRRYEYAEPFSWVPWVAFAIYMLVAKLMLDANPLSLAGSVLFVATLGSLVITLIYGVQEQRRQWQDEHQPHGRSTMLVEFLIHLTGLLMICLIIYRIHH